MTMMKAMAAIPGQRGSVHLAGLAAPRLDEAPAAGVLVRVLGVGLDGTDREIDDADYGVAPPGSDFLVLGHERTATTSEGSARCTAS